MKNKLRISIVAGLVAGAALALASCSEFPLGGTTAAAGSSSSAAGAIAVDVQQAAAAAIQDYAEYKSGNANMAWALSKGVWTYQTVVKTAADMKAVAKAWTGNTGDSQKLADRLARIFASSTAPPAAKAAAIASAAQMVAANSGP